ncbi:DNA-binding protein [Leptolyngbya sp. AN03gr2]|uniref:helix-turn-helix domain-containing transcriptional regulator n=1 Tax=unclassified Leptolyngbya TaxID=2650499 RepID=UPI003D323D30
MPTTKSYHTFLIESLRDPEEAAAYLDSVLEDGDPQHIRLALKNVVEARAQATEVEEAAKWQHCYESLEKGEMPDLLMLVELLNQLNMRLSIAQKS